MTYQQIILWTILLVLPTTYQRTKFALNRQAFFKIRLREKSGLQIHHGHWGLLMVLIGSISLAFGLHNTITIGIVALGWGLVLDEVIPLLKMPTVGREIELQVYEKTARASIIVVVSMALISMLIYFV